MYKNAIAITGVMILLLAASCGSGGGVLGETIDRDSSLAASGGQAYIVGLKAGYGPQDVIAVAASLSQRLTRRCLARLLLRSLKPDSVRSAVRWPLTSTAKASS